MQVYSSDELVEDNGGQHHHPCTIANPGPPAMRHGMSLMPSPGPFSGSYAIAGAYANRGPPLSH